MSKSFQISHETKGTMTDMKHQETLLILVDCYHGTTFAYILLRFYRFHGRSRKNLERFPYKKDAKSTTRAKSFRLGGLLLKK